MAYFTLFYDVVEDFVAQRQPFREEHLGLARASQSRGEMILGGALADPFDRALLVFRAPERGVAEAFAKNDPYVLNGLVKKWEVRVWNVVVGTAYEAGASK